MSLKNDQDYMAAALAKAREGISDGQTPFGSCIVKNGEVVACEHNRVWDLTDITAHAEVVAIRSACVILKTIDLSGCVIYSTCEPCPMCFSAIHWANIKKIVYGASIDDAKQGGFHELEISNQSMKDMGKSSIEIVGGVLADECQQLFNEWKQYNGKPY